MDDTTDLYNDYPTIHTLIQRAQKVRQRRIDDTISYDPSQLSYPTSSYNMKAIEGSNSNILSRSKKDKTVQRGFCNWLIPQTIMIGQYPGMTPESYGPKVKESQLHIQKMITDANISLFCCLQTEVPAQDDDITWNKNGGEIYLEPEYLRREFPRPFTRYAPIAESFASKNQQQLTFIHSPIEDLTVPTCNDDLLSLLSQLLHHLEDNGIIYLHCWGGRGRAGLVGACLASLIFPEMSSKQILDWVQRGYDTRLGAEYMSTGLKRSPQTQQQRQFVTEFVDNVHSERDEVKW